ncbi:MAG: four helix bundle protein [Acidobacteriota bacterium]|nr:four helix bundle protein [Acidobacteriota bacterium]
MDYRDLVAWQRAMTLTELVYHSTSQFPAEERYGLTSQMRRAAAAIPSNIAEGQGRRSSDADFARFLSIALGSLCELETQIELTIRLGFVSREAMATVIGEAGEVGRLLNGLIRSKQH